MGALANTLHAPAQNLFYEGKVSIWKDTGHQWGWYTTNYTTYAPVGAANYQTLLTNNGSALQSITLNVSADNVTAGVSINGVAQKWTCVAGFDTVCSATYAIQPGTSVLSMQIVNGNDTPNPAGFSAWVVNNSTGATVTDMNVNGRERWTKY